MTLEPTGHAASGLWLAPCDVQTPAVFEGPAPASVVGVQGASSGGVGMGWVGCETELGGNDDGEYEPEMGGGVWAGVSEGGDYARSFL